LYKRLRALRNRQTYLKDYTRICYQTELERTVLRPKFIRQSVERQTTVRRTTQHKSTTEQLGYLLRAVVERRLGVQTWPPRVSWNLAMSAGLYPFQLAAAAFKH